MYSHTGVYMHYSAKAKCYYIVQLFTTPSSSQDTGFPSIAEAVATGNVNVRSGPGVSYEIVGELARGECLTYLNETRYDADGHAWYKAQYYSYGEVWVSSVYSELTYTRTEASVDDEAGTYGRYIQATGRLNVRSGPGLGYDDKGTLLSGSTATYLGEYSTDERGVTWYKISYNGGSGWVSSRYCTLH